MLLCTFVLFTLLRGSSMFGASAENCVGKTASVLWIFQVQARDVPIPTGEQNDKINYKLSFSGRPINQFNMAASTGNVMPPFVELGGRQYYFQKYFKANFFKSFQFCRNHGMDLLSIETNDENDHIMNYLRQNMTKIDDHYWTSGTDLAEEGSFVWLSTGREFTFTNWAPQNPNNHLNNEHCSNIRPEDKNWNDIKCTNEYYFAC